ncbi:MAG TPA: sigma-70 family RNA polymerase sigma factor [Solirubrobacterales bacterium]|nr:sigma-70 family RNA polymerase sigma factor [Solirubrobacterales bacterium]
MGASTIKVTDEELMVRAQGDDALAFAELYGRHVEDALRIAEDICRDHDRAEETVQDGFFSIWRSRAEYRPGLGSFGIWSMRIVHNRAVDSFRVMRGRPRLQAETQDGDPLEETGEDPTLAAAIAASERAQMLDALRHLPDRQAEVIVLSFYGDLTLSEIAHRLEIPTGTVKGRMRLGLEKLRGEWALIERRSVGRVIH